MRKTVLLTTASIIFLSAAAQARVDIKNEHDFEVSIGMSQKQAVQVVDDRKQTPLTEQFLLERPNSPKLPASLVVDFAKFAYAVDKKNGWDTSAKKIYNELINDGWKLEPFNGTTGTAYHPVESVSGLLAFKEDQVVIATRGTEMDNWNDWMTNFRFSRDSIKTAQFFGISGEVADGFLDSHLSSWDFIQKAIIQHAASLGKEPKDLFYTITGHSLGAAKAQLNALRLLTDPALGIGVSPVEKSFIDSSLTEDLTMSGFYGIGTQTAPHNPGNVRVLALEAPRLFDDKTAQQVDNIIGKHNLLRVENEGRVLGDPVIYLPPWFLGFEHSGTPITINQGPVFYRHLIGTVSQAAIPALTAVYG